MIGTSLSRWTLGYFATALTGLIAAELLMTAGFGFPSDPVEAPETFVFVHIVAIGWLTALGLAKLYNVVAFLTWLECYGPLLGKRLAFRISSTSPALSSGCTSADVAQRGRRAAAMASTYPLMV